MSAVVMTTDVPMVPLCKALSVPRSSAYRRRRPAVPAKPRPTPRRALSPLQRQAVLDELHSDRFVDRAPAEVVHTLASEGTYLASERTMYRILDANEEVKERRAQREHPRHAAPELMATRPNEVWSWDITRLRTNQKWVYLYLYVIIDIFSRAVVGWMVATTETATLGCRLIDETLAKHDVHPGTLVLHADRGAQMTSKVLAQLLADLVVERSLSRPQVSNDNPFSESAFKTLKYSPKFPGKFANVDDAVSFCREYFEWYNNEHRHSGIAYLTPSEVHSGEADDALQRRHELMLAAFAANPERFVHGAPRRQTLAPAVFINPPKPVDLRLPPSPSSSPSKTERSEVGATTMGTVAPAFESEPSCLEAVH